MPDCARCSEDYLLRDGQVRTPLCDGCAHSLVDEIRAADHDAGDLEELGALIRRLLREYRIEAGRAEEDVPLVWVE